MVKEIRDAAEIRENALISKVEALIEKCIKSKSGVRFTYAEFLSNEPNFAV